MNISVALIIGGLTLMSASLEANGYSVFASILASLENCVAFIYLKAEIHRVEKPEQLTRAAITDSKDILIALYLTIGWGVVLLAIKFMSGSMAAAACGAGIMTLLTTAIAVQNIEKLRAWSS